MGLDIGTTGSKAVIFDEQGQILSKEYAEYRLYHREPHFSELNPCEVWDSIKKVIRESVKKSSIDPKEIKAVSTAVLGEAFIPVDQQGRPLYWSMTTYDARAINQTIWWEENFGSESMFKITGQPLTRNMPIYTLQKIQWLKSNKPQIFAKTWKFLCWEDYFNFKLTGKAITDYTVACRTMCFDMVKRRWSDEILDIAALDESMLPEVKPSGHIVGEVTEKGAQEVGLNKGALVIVGGHDQPCGSLGAGIVEEGSLMDATGTVECYGVVQDSLVINDHMRRQGFAIHNYVIHDKYFMFGFTPTGGSILRWFRDNFGFEEKEEAKQRKVDEYDILTSKALKVKPGASNLFLFPYFEGSGTPTWDRRGRGTLIGLTLSHTKSDIIRAILESLAYELKLNIKTIESYDIKVKDVRAIGGGAKSSLWLQIKADITGKEILVPMTKMEATALGAAMLAAKGAGIYRDISEATKYMHRISERYTPKAENKKIYDKTYHKYMKLARILKNTYIFFG